MGHLSLDDLDEILQEAAKLVVVGGTYRHYKGLTYTVLNVVIWEETDEPAVVYRADYDERLTFARSFVVWRESVHVDGRSVPRFSLVAKS
ncbi:MAG TPA: DUF1653 domain-containing protein [Bacillota bacterium]|nr:DUF1653 domain-containing protein [Bacillota bacterium]